MAPSTASLWVKRARDAGLFGNPGATASGRGRATAMASIVRKPNGRWQRALLRLGREAACAALRAEGRWHSAGWTKSPPPWSAGTYVSTRRRPGPPSSSGRRLARRLRDEASASTVRQARIHLRLDQQGVRARMRLPDVRPSQVKTWDELLPSSGPRPTQLRLRDLSAARPAHGRRGRRRDHPALAVLAVKRSPPLGLNQTALGHDGASLGSLRGLSGGYAIRRSSSVPSWASDRQRSCRPASYRRRLYARSRHPGLIAVPRQRRLKSQARPGRQHPDSGPDLRPRPPAEVARTGARSLSDDARSCGRTTPWSHRAGCARCPRETCGPAGGVPLP